MVWSIRPGLRLISIECLLFGAIRGPFWIMSGPIYHFVMMLSPSCLPVLFYWTLILPWTLWCTHFGFTCMTQVLCLVSLACSFSIVPWTFFWLNSFPTVDSVTHTLDSAPHVVSSACSFSIVLWTLWYIHFGTGMWNLEPFQSYRSKNIVDIAKTWS